MPKESKMSPRRITAVQKQRQALELRMAGRTWQEIADNVGYKGHSGAIAAVESALLRTLQPPANEYRALTLERLTKVLQVHWPSMLQGDYSSGRMVLQAIGDIRKLMGLDAPVQMEHGGNGIPIQHEVVSVELGDINDALQVLATAGAIRLEPNGHQLNGAVDGIYPTSSDC